MSSQVKGLGRYTAYSYNQKKDNKYKTKSNQNYQKIKLYGSLTTKELKKKHSFRLLGGAEMGSQAGEDMWQGGSWQSHICVQINWEEQLGIKTDCTTPGSSVGK